MADQRKKVVLDYAATESLLPEHQSDALRGIGDRKDGDRFGAFSLNLDGDGWLPFLVGTGVPITLEVFDIQPSQVIRAL